MSSPSGTSGAQKGWNRRWSMVRGLGLTLACLLSAAGGVQAQFAYQKPKLTLSASSIDYGLAQRGEIQYRTLVIRNTGTANLIVERAWVTESGGGIQHFVCEEDAPGEVPTLPPGASFTLHVHAYGTSTERDYPDPDGMARVSGSLNIQSNASSYSTRVVPLTATLTGPYLITTPEPEPYYYSPYPTIPIDFGSQPAGSSAGPVTITLTNIGDQAGVLDGPLLPGDPLDQLWSVVPQDPGWSGILNPGEAITFDVSVYFGAQGSMDTECLFRISPHLPHFYATGAKRRLLLKAHGD